MKTQKGITLIALIITIIVMLILVGVSVSVALNTGLFKTAQSAAKNTQIAREKETALSNGEINVGGTDISIDEYIDRLSTGMPVELKVGDIIEYTPASNYTSESPYVVSNEEIADLKLAGCSGSFYTDMTNAEWKVIAVEGNTIKIIPNVVSSSKLTLTGANGWNNSIDALNSVCGAIYGNTTSEKYTATAKSITVKDINGITGYESTPSEKSYHASDYGSNNYFPIEYLKEKGVETFTADEISQGYAANSDITVENTHYGYKAETQTGFNTKFANWVNLGSVYWLASRCVSTYQDYSVANGTLYSAFCVRYLSKVGNVGDDSVLVTKPIEYTPNYAVRPVVSLTPTVSPTIEKTEGEGDSAINYWTFGE